MRVPISSASLFLAHRLPEFTRAHPNVSIRLVSNIWAESAGRDQVDVELRLGKGEWEDAPFEKISEERIVPIASSMRAQKGSLSPQDLLQGAADTDPRLARHVAAILCGFWIGRIPRPWLLWP